MSKQVFVALLVGLVASFAFLGLSVYSDELELDLSAKAFDWPNTLLQSFFPLNNLGTPEHPVMEGSPLNDLAFLASIPFGALVYGTVFFLGRRFFRRVP